MLERKEMLLKEKKIELMEKEMLKKKKELEDRENVLLQNMKDINNNTAESNETIAPKKKGKKTTHTSHKNEETQRKQ